MSSGTSEEARIPTVTSVVAVWTGHVPPADGWGALPEVLDAKYGSKPPKVHRRDSLVTALVGYSLNPTVADAMTAFKALQDAGHVTNRGTPDDVFAGTVASGPVVAFFFWQKTSAAGKKRRWFG